jgi:hypothetical protein
VRVGKPIQPGRAAGPTLARCPTSFVMIHAKGNNIMLLTRCLGTVGSCLLVIEHVEGACMSWLVWVTG